MAPGDGSYSGSHIVSGSGPRYTPLAISGGGATSAGGSPRGTTNDTFTSHRWTNVQLSLARIVARAPLAPPGMSVVSHLAGVEVDVEQVALRREPDELDSGWGRQHRTAELLDDQSAVRVVVVARGRVVDGAGRVVSTESCSGDAVGRFVERRRRRTGRQVTAGLGDHPDDPDHDGHTGTDAQRDGGCGPRAVDGDAVASAPSVRARHGAAWSAPRRVRSRSTRPLTHHHTTTPSGGGARDDVATTCHGRRALPWWLNERTGSSLERRAERVAAATDPRT